MKFIVSIKEFYQKCINGPMFSVCFKTETFSLLFTLHYVEWRAQGDNQPRLNVCASLGDCGMIYMQILLQ